MLSKTQSIWSTSTANVQGMWKQIAQLVLKSIIECYKHIGYLKIRCLESTVNWYNTRQILKFLILRYNISWLSRVRKFVIFCSWDVESIHSYSYLAMYWIFCFYLFISPSQLEKNPIFSTLISLSICQFSSSP